MGSTPHDAAREDMDLPMITAYSLARSFKWRLPKIPEVTTRFTHLPHMAILDVFADLTLHLAVGHPWAPVSYGSDDNVPMFAAADIPDSAVNFAGCATIATVG